MSKPAARGLAAGGAPATAAAVLDAYYTALASLDPARIAACYADDGEIEDPVGSPVRRGREAITAYWAAGLCGIAAAAEVEILAAFEAGGALATHWRITATAPEGTTRTTEGIDVLRLGADGLIHRAEGYWDRSAFRAQLAGL